MSKPVVAPYSLMSGAPPHRYRFRLLATGFCFLLFSSGMLLFALIVVALRICVWDAARRLRLVQSILGSMLRFFRRTIVRFGLISVRADGLQQLLSGEPKIIVCNHPTLIDAPLLLSFFPKLCCVVKGELYDRWAYRTVMQDLGFLAIGSSEHPVERCAEAVREGRSILIFPEGTRSPPGGMHRFARGAVSIALRSGAPLVPIVLRSDQPLLGKNQPWHAIPLHPIDFLISIRYPFLSKTSPVDRASERELSLKLTNELEEFFKRAVLQSS